MTNVDTSRYEEIADSQQDDLIAIIACVEADNIENPTDVGQDYFDAKVHREDWTIVGNPSLESTSSNHESHADGLAVAGQPEGWVLGGSSMGMAEADPFYDPLEETLDDLASECSGASEEEDRLVWGE